MTSHTCALQESECPKTDYEIKIHFVLVHSVAIIVMSIAISGNVCGHPAVRSRKNILGAHTTKSLGTP